MIKIDVISGFLGAGKTTLIKKLFESSFKDEKVVIIENEFGEIGIDSSFLKESGVQIKEINAGCICCSLVGDFSSSIKELVEKYNPDRIIIEPSGVGKLSDIVEAIKNVDIANLKLNILATVVDGLKAKMYLKNFGEFFVNQIEKANTIVVSKMEKLSPNKLDDVISIVKTHNSIANIITTPLQDFESEKLLNILQEQVNLSDALLKETLNEVHHHHDEHCCCGHHDHHHDENCSCGHHHHHHADEVFHSWGKQTAQSISYEQLNTFLDHLANDEDLGIIIRAKGILKASDRDSWYYFDFVSGDYEIREGEADYTGRIVVIGANLNTSKVEELFMER